MQLTYNIPKIEQIRDTACTGCSSCANICPVNAIEMKEDEKGFFKPKISPAKCIQCGLCNQSCPILKAIEVKQISPHLFAIQAEDEIRLKSSSGGVFTLVAEKFLRDGGVVFGASWTNNFSVAHQVAADFEQLEKLKKSKYVQSFIGLTYRQVESYLHQNKPVLFVGTGCQIAGLKNYIKCKNIDDEKLVCMDLWCFSVPSQKIFKRYLSDCYGKNLEAFQFRTKQNRIYSSMCFTYKIFGQQPQVVTGKSYWFNAYFSLLFENNACEKCRFQSDKRCGDLSIGDFWGIEQHDVTIEDGLGTSMVQANTEKGLTLIGQISSDCKLIKEVPLNWIRVGQGNGKKKHIHQQLFYDLIEQGIPFKKAVDMAMQGKKYDIGMCCVQVYNNFGSGITNFALYKLLKSYGLEVLIITQPYSSMISPDNMEFFLKDPFNREDRAKHYKDKNAMRALNKIVNKFLVGSDQLFNYGVYQYIDSFTKLDWVDDEHKKVSYATSFGMNRLWGSAEEIEDFRRCIRRFDKVSVRESNAVDLVRNNFDIYADLVMDPVFLCDKQEYIELIKPYISDLPKGQAFCYILDPAQEKASLLNRISNILKKDLFVVSDLANSPQRLKELWDQKCQNIRSNEQWLASIYNADYVIADSFHGLCFAIIFNKPFVVVNNTRRGNERASSLLRLIGYENRIIDCSTSDDTLKHLLNQKIDYEQVNSIIQSAANKSRLWFEQNVVSKN